MLGERGMQGFPRFVVKKLLTCVMTPPFSAPYLELNIDRILVVMDADNEFKRALRGTILEIADDPADPVHDALVVRAPILRRIARAGDAGAAHATLLLELLRPSIVRAIKSECVEGQYLYRGLVETEMQTLVELIGNSAIRSRNDRPPLLPDVVTYARESALPFRERTMLRARGPLCFWDTSHVDDLFHLFDGTRFSSDLMWPTQNVVRMDFAFARSTFNGKIGHLYVGRVQSMDDMFAQNREFNQPIGDWDVRNVRSMFFMFYEAAAFDQPIGKWVVGNVRDMGFMFKGARLFNQEIGSWVVRRVESMRRMFKRAYSFNNLEQPLDRWDVSYVTDMTQMFKHARSFNRPLHDWNIVSVSSMFQMFMGASSLARAPQWDLGHVLDTHEMLRDTPAEHAER
jgi:hypothetical protein